MTGDPDRRGDWDQALDRLLHQAEDAAPPSSRSGVTEPTAESIAAGGAYRVDPPPPPPLIALVPLASCSGPVAGRRVRRRSADGAVWLLDLRVWEEPAGGVVRLAHEGDWYRLRVARVEPPLLPISYDVDVSAVYVEQYLSGTSGTKDDELNPNAWMRRLDDDRLNPPPIVPVPARRAGPLLGRRAIICAHEGMTTDVRVVSEPTDDGQRIVVNTIAEADWHIHAAINPGVDVWRSFRAAPVDQVWIES
jgi:hypothetical protein